MKIGIVGGGIGGLSTAICLSAIGVEVEVFERASEIRENGAGVSLWPNATRVLARMGLLQKCLENSTPLISLEIKNLRGKVLLHTRIDHDDAPVFCMRRPDLLAILHAKVSEDSIFLNHTCKKISNAGAKVVVEFEGQKSRMFDAVVGADGARSRVRAYVTGLTQEPVYRGYEIWRGVADFDLGANSSSQSQETWGTGRRFGILPMGGKSLCWYATDTRPEEHDGHFKNHKTELLRLFRGWPEPILEIIQATRPQEILKNAASDLSLRGPWFHPKAVVLGDAAHPLTPNVGQGSCLALEDSWVLSQLLKGARDAHGIARAFELFGRARRKRVPSIVRTTRWIGSFAQTKSKSVVFTRDRLLPVLFPLAFDWAVRPIHRYDAMKTSS